MYPSLSISSRKIGSRAKQAPILALALMMLATSPVQAGIMDSVSGFFSKTVESVKGMFGGGKKASSGDNAEFEKFLDQMEASQQALATAQTELITYYNDNPDTVDIEDAQAQEMNNAVTDASRTNEDLYLQLLQVRSQLLEQEANVEAYQGRLETIQANQKQLEERYQEIQTFNKDSGLIEPPPAADDAGFVADPDPVVAEAFNPEDTKVRGIIDEWLAMQNLDEYGRNTGVVNGGVITANYAPDQAVGMQRHTYVWGAYWNKSPNGGQTLHDYVQARLGGGDAGTPPSTGEPPATTESGGSTDFAGAIDTGDASAALASTEAPASPGSANLDSIDAKLKATIQELQDLQADQRGTGPDAQTLLTKIRMLQEERNAMVGQGN